ncbi:MAG: hypothetical protein K8H74_20055 [Notoacmeibacter sp.]|nr:hypothetical protein [Notoacmeibacter sp.]
MSKLFKLLLIVFFVSVYSDAAQPPFFHSLDNGVSHSSPEPSINMAMVETDDVGKCRVDAEQQNSDQVVHCAADCVFLTPGVAIPIRAIRQLPHGRVSAGRQGARVPLPRRPPIAAWVL